MCHTYHIPKDRGEIRQCLYDKIAALSGFLKHLGLHPLQICKRLVKILSWLAATLTDFLRKGQLVSVQCGWHKNFNSQYKILKGRVKILLNVQRHMSPHLPNEPHHFQANLIW
jgi:hypothetical protein